MNKLLYILSLITSAFSFSCADSYRIVGTSNLWEVDGKTITLMTAENDEWRMLDSCEVLHGQFEMRGKVDSCMITTLFLDGHPIMPVILEPGNMDVTISKMVFKVGGTPLNDSLYAFIARKYRLDMRFVEMERMESQMIMNGHSQQEIQHYIDSVYQVLSEDMQGLVCDFVGSNYHNVLGLCGFSMLCNGLPYPVITPLIQSVLDAAPASFLSHPTIVGFLQQAQENMDKYDMAEMALGR